MSTAIAQSFPDNGADPVDCAYLFKGFISLWEKLPADECENVKDLYGEGELEFMGRLWERTIECAEAISAVVDFEQNDLSVFAYEHLDDTSEGELVHFLWQNVIVERRNPIERMSYWAAGHDWVQNETA